MHELNYTEFESLTCLRAFQSVKEQCPFESEIGDKFIQTIQVEFFKTSFEFNTLKSIPLNQLGKALPNRKVREALCKFLVILALCDTKIHLPHLQYIKKIDKILNTKEHSIKNLYQAYYHQLRRLRHDIRLRAFGSTKKNLIKSH